MSDVLDSLVGGFWLNLQIFVMTLLMALPLGLVITFGSMTKFLSLIHIFPACGRRICPGA